MNAPSAGDHPVLPETDDEREARDEWLFFQRAYPFGGIPADARRKAWLARPGADLKALAAGETWKAIGPNPISSAPLANWGLTSGRINAVAISPANSQLVLVGAADGGIWRSTDGGVHFVPVADDQVDLSVGSIAFSESNPNTVFAAMGSNFLGTGVLQSTDAGLTWQRVSNNSLPTPGQIPKILVDPKDASRVYVAQYAAKSADGFIFSSGFYRSTDGGVNWRKTLSGLPQDMALDPLNPGTLYLALSRVDEAGNLPAGLYKSVDGGLNWAHIYHGPFDPQSYPQIRIAVTPTDPSKLYAFGGGFIDGEFDLRVGLSTDGGASWADRKTKGLRQSVWDYLAADPTHADTLYLDQEDLFKSTDGGATWSNLTQNYTATGEFRPGSSNAHADQHCLAFAPDDASAFFVGTDGGLYQTTDSGTTFKSRNDSFSLTQFYSLAVHPTDATRAYGGTQDNGSVRRLLGSPQWKEIITGDGGYCVINPLDPSTVFTTYIYGTVFRWREHATQFDGTVGSNTKFDEPASGARIGFIAPFTGNGVDATLYFGTWRLFISDDLGATWSAPAGKTDLTQGFSDVLTAIGIGPANLKVIYTGSSFGRAMVSTDGGKNWNDITSGLPNRFIKSITVDRRDSATAYLTVSGYASGHVFKTNDFGAHWIDISGNLPDIPTNALLVDSTDANIIYLGTDIGVFRSTTGGGAWEEFNDGMPPVVVNAFAAQPGGAIQAATYGRGAYQLTSPALTPTISVVNFDGKKSLTIDGSKFGSSPYVFINNIDRSNFIKSASDTKISLKAKAKKLGLKGGDNTVVVINGAAESSAPYILTR